MLESSCFRIPFGSQHTNGSQTLLKPALQHFHANFLLISDKLSWKASVLVKSKILGLFFDTVTFYHTHSRQNWEEVSQQVPTTFDSKPKTFLEIFIAFLKSG